MQHSTALERANALLSERKFQEAAAAFDAVLRANPKNAAAFSGAAICYSQMGQDGVAIGLFNAALMLLPDSAALWANVGQTLRRCGHVEWARSAYGRSLQCEPDNVMGLRGMAGSYVNDGNPAEGVKWGERAAAVDPSDPRNTHDLALCLMELGRWDEAWPHWRRRVLDGHSTRSYPGDYWRGEDVDWLIVHGEQGLGDEVMFLGCLPQLLDRAHRGVILEVNPRLVPLVRASFPQCTVIGSEAEFRHPGAGVIAHIRLGDLPELCEGGVPPKVSGYLTAGLRPGYADAVLLAMKGGTASTHDYLRNPPVETWRPVVEAIRGVGLRPVSIQYTADGPAMAEALDIEHGTAAASDLMVQAAAIRSAVALVSVQQTALHLGGAVGARVFGVISAKPAWRYGLCGAMPWYETVHLHRQMPDDDGWAGVMARVAESVARLRERVAA